MKIRNLIIALAAVALISVPAIAQQPEDDCDGVLVVPGGAAVTVNPAGDATPTGPRACVAGTGITDSWLHFVATATEVRIRTDLGSAGTDSNVTVYTKDCANQQIIACQEDIGGGVYLNDLCVTGLVVGDTYTIQVGDWNDGGTGSYDVTVTDGAAGGETCGDGVINCGEACDGADVGSCPTGACDANCQCPKSICGNDIIEAGEVCDGTDPGPCPTGTCDPDCDCPDPICGNGILEPGEECDGTDNSNCEVSCESDCTCTPDVCGNNIAGPSEECDGTDDSACLIGCDALCACNPIQTPALPAWGVVGLALLLLVGGAFAFRRRSQTA